MDALTVELSEDNRSQDATEPRSSESLWLKAPSTSQPRAEVTVTNWYAVRFIMPLSWRTALASEQVLAQIWDTPEEDEAWRDL